jgi:hypothetical protein
VELADLLEVLLNEWVWRAAPALVWAAGPFLALFRISVNAAVGSALAAFVCGAWLTYHWRRGSRWAAVFLLAGALVSLAVSAAILVRGPPS